MLRTVSLTFFLPCWLLAQTSGVSREDAGTPEVREMFQKLYSQMDAAFAQGKWDDLLAMALPDARVKWPLPMSYKDSLPRKEFEAGIKFIRRSTVEAVKMIAGEAVVSIRGETTINSPNGNRVSRNTFSDTWTQVDGVWKLKEQNRVSFQAVVPPTDARTAQVVAAELKQRAVPLAAVRAGVPFDDLRAFGQAVGDARIVSLGEATHGTREFFQMKHRLLEYLVREKGFTVFAIEANWPESLAVDRYIKTGEGDPKAALAGMYFWTWNTQEVLEMIEWMRAYNKAPGSHAMLSFTSFDMQEPKVAMESVIEYLRRYSAGSVEADYESLRDVSGGSGEMYKESASKAATQAEAVLKLIDSRQEELVKASSVSAWRDARHAADIARQAATMRITGNGAPYRDQMMAGNIEWILREEHPAEKIVLWAHNNHVGTDRVEQPARSMGAWLRQKFGPQMYTVGFAFSTGEVRAIGRGGDASYGVTNYIIPALPADTGEAVLRSAGLPLFFLDLRSVPPVGTLGQWLAQPHRFPEIGAIWYTDKIENNLPARTMSKAFDGLIYVEEGHASKGL